MLLQVGFKRELIKEVEIFKADARAFRNEWELHGPMVPGLDPTEAVDRLKKFMQMFEVRHCKPKKLLSHLPVCSLTFMQEFEVKNSGLSQDFSACVPGENFGA